MTVADCHCKRIGGIVGLGDFIKMQKNPCHLLNLRLFRPAVADYTLLDLKRCVFVNWYALLVNGKHYNAPRLRNINGGLLVGVEIKPFNTYRIGFKAFKQFGYAVINLDKAVGKGISLSVVTAP